jgi:ubiquinone/menaquinone biosynthesis C-methylase UbiE
MNHFPERPGKHATWRRKSEVFDRLAGEYDNWFDDSKVFSVECACLQSLTSLLSPPRLEIGVGPGRFAEALGVAHGIDPALAALRFAGRRKILVCQARGEELPYAAASFGTVFLLFSLCFVEDRAEVLREARRVLRPGGLVVLGLVPAGSPWGEAILQKKEGGHPFYRYINLLASREVMVMLREAGFKIIAQRSALLEPPNVFTGQADCREGLVGKAGFVVLAGQKQKDGSSADESEDKCGNSP